MAHLQNWFGLQPLTLPPFCPGQKV